MDPVIGAAAIQGGGGLLGEYLKQQAEKKRQQEMLAAQAQEKAFAQQSNAIDKMSEGQQAALQRLIGGFQQALG